MITGPRLYPETSRKMKGLHARRPAMDPNWLTAIAALVAAVATFITAVPKK